MNAFLLKFLKTFLTSLTIYISRKLIHYIDCFCTNKLNEERSFVTCDSCGISFDKEIIYHSHQKTCPNCLTVFNADFSDYEYRPIPRSSNFNTNYT